MELPRDCYLALVSTNQMPSGLAEWLQFGEHVAKCAAYTLEVSTGGAHDGLPVIGELSPELAEALTADVVAADVAGRLFDGVILKMILTVIKEKIKDPEILTVVGLWLKQLAAK